MKKIISIVVIIAIIAAGVVYVPKLVHTCDSCNDFFIGAGYEANVVSDLLSDEQQVICKKCAEEQHALSIKLGKSLDDFKINIFE